MNNSPVSRAGGARLHSAAMAQSGVGLIEVLMAVLVLSIAFLGMAALQATSLSTNNSAMARSMATIASYSIMDAMRADIGGARNGAYNTSVTGDACPAASGSLAGFQLNRWCSTELGNKSLGAVASTIGEIACQAAGTASASCTVTITFDDSRAGVGGSKTQKVITKAML
jgi:type IV pilus assembly protein PilV